LRLRPAKSRQRVSSGLTPDSPKFPDVRPGANTALDIDIPSGDHRIVTVRTRK
jgi:hypothetical protein